METLLISPLLGLDGLAALKLRKNGLFDDVTLSPLPVVVAMLVLLLAPALFPGLAPWLPGVNS